MKQLVQVQEVEGEGYLAFMGRNITLFCDTYIYTGKLVGVNDDFLKLETPSIVYETGGFDTKSWKDAQKLPNELYVNLSHIESFAEVK